GVELRELAQANGGRFQGEGGHRQLRAAALLLLAEGIQLRNVGQVVLRDMRNGAPRQVHQLRRTTADRVKRLPFDLTPAAEVRECGRWAAARSRRRSGCKLANIVLDVLLRDASATSGAVDLAQINAEFAGHQPGRGTGRDDDFPNRRLRLRAGMYSVRG